MLENGLTESYCMVRHSSSLLGAFAIDFHNISPHKLCFGQQILP